MSTKVVFLQYVPYLQCDEDFQPGSLRATTSCSTVQKTAVVLNRRGNSLSIQGYPEVPCREKHKCWTLFQHAVKQLLGVPNNRAVCIRFSETPFSTLTSLTEIFQEPNQIVNLSVVPLPSSLSLSTSNDFSPQGYCCVEPEQSDSLSKRDPYCKYREMFHQGRQSSESKETCVRQKCNFTEMAKLLSQLEEVSLTLERTQNHIALRCGHQASKASPSTDTHVDVPRPACDSGKGSSVSDSEHSDFPDAACSDEATFKSCLSVEDRNVEQLLQFAESLTLNATSTKMEFKDGPDPLSGSSDTIHADDNEATVRLPDRPTDVVVRPSFTEGGIYVMWNPVRLDGLDMNNRHTVLGYMVYVDKCLRAKVDGPLSSQVELVKDLELTKEYSIQVCTHTNHCNSLLSSPVKYRPSLTTKKARCRKTSVSIKQQEHKSKVARVESWLLNGHISQTKIPLAEGVHANVSGKALTSSISDGYSTPDHHVHFASNAAPVTSPTYEEHFSQWTSPRQHPLHTAEVGTHMTDSGCDDTRSTGSSHTSGIVTDFPMSPSHKQPSSFDCPHCSNVSSATHSLARDSDVLLSNLHLYSDDGFHTLPRYTCHEEANSLLGTKSTVSSTLCPSMRLSRASSIDNSCSTGDTVIDEPINVYRSKPQVSQMPVTKHSDDSKGRSRVRTFFKVKKQRGPDPPANLFAYLDSTGEDNMLVLEWTPVSRNSKGCSNGFFVLGYRIYLNDVFQQSVDGARTCQTRIRCPALQHIKLEVRSRAMAGESVSSKPVLFNLLTHQQAVKDTTLQSSSYENQRAETYV